MTVGLLNQFGPDRDKSRRSEKDLEAEVDTKAKTFGKPLRWCHKAPCYRPLSSHNLNVELVKRGFAFCGASPRSEAVTGDPDRVTRRISARIRTDSSFYLRRQTTTSRAGDATKHGQRKWRRAAGSTNDGRQPSTSLRLCQWGSQQVTGCPLLVHSNPSSRTRWSIAHVFCLFVCFYFILNNWMYKPVRQIVHFCKILQEQIQEM